MDERTSFSNPQFASFQDFSPGNRYADGHTELDLGTPSHQSYGASGVGMMEDLQGFSPNNQGPPPATSKNFWTIEYYQQFFNVTTNDVVIRLKRSMIPTGMEDYLSTYIRPNPDLYGPFWVCVTLIFSIAISGNIANYFQSASSGNYHWKYEFHIVSQAATCIFLYAWLLPLLLWGALNWLKSPDSGELIESSSPSVKLLELLCLYGYSLTIYIPVAFLWTIQINLLQWTLVIVATILSGGVLLKSLLPVIPTAQKPIYSTVILGMHLILAVGFMLFFFHVPSTSHQLNSPTVASGTNLSPVVNNSNTGR